MIHRQGLGTSPILFEDYWNPDREQVLARMREEYEETSRVSAPVARAPRA